MTLSSLLAAIGDRLTTAGIPYMVTGSVASSFHGAPRATRDIDLVIDPTPDALDRFLRSLPSAMFYVEPDAARMALASRTSFNVIDKDGAWKVDLLMRRDRPFSVKEFARRQSVELLGTQTAVASAEDLVIAKLEWAMSSGSERQLRDVAEMLAVGGDALDLAYVERWVAELGLGAMWSKVRPA